MIKRLKSLKSLDLVELIYHVSRIAYDLIPCKFLLNLSIKLDMKLHGFYELPIVLACIFSNNLKPTVYDTDALHDLSQIFMKVMPKIFSERAVDSWSRDKFKEYFKSFIQPDEDDMKMHLLLDVAMADMSLFKIFIASIRDSRVYDQKSMKKALENSFMHKYAIDTLEDVARCCREQLTKFEKSDMIGTA